ncbi:methyltransferase domain-containing protein [Streptomyces albipurpureus]|uniref:Methyltransferase domain-containing protein n=1 Tax=Streptomyces albipurpureus TaxID=2897419 RepID=A0ABT0UKC8_9ACTN|nr:methyltransferase domain-containing protein [Streptomyces sp. CWNU-1]MCM2388712.1 methyltransferase domain-containing protein [Streptomyces sp. CWNU-1]
MKNWTSFGARLAEQVADPDSRWRAPVASVPRHELIPRWWERDGEGRWRLRAGAADPEAWMEAAYTDTSLVTRVGALHADHAKLDDQPEGTPTSSATMPGLVVTMLRHGRLGDGVDLLDLGTGAGGLAAYAARRLGDQHVTSLDVDPYLTAAAEERLARFGLRPRFLATDATAEIPGSYDRIIATVGMPAGSGLRPVLGALRVGGRLVATLARTTIILTGWKQADGDVVGIVERDLAGFMSTRSGDGDDGSPALADLLGHARQADGEVTTGRYPVLDVSRTWELRTMLEIAAPGTEAHFRQEGQQRTTCLIHPDGSWARACAEWTDQPTVHQGGPQRLWSVLERIRHRLNMEGALPLLGARVRITGDGVVHLSRGKWSATMGH